MIPSSTVCQRNTPLYIRIKANDLFIVGEGMENDVLGAGLLAVTSIARDPLILDVHTRNTHHLHAPSDIHILIMSDEGKMTNTQQEAR